MTINIMTLGIFCSVEYCYAECRDYLYVMLRVIMFNAVMLSDVVVSVIMLNVIMLSVMAPCQLLQS